MINKIKCYFRENPNYIYSIIVIFFALILTYYLVTLQIKVGIVYWDVYLYLNNALMFAGLGEGYKQQLSPMLPFLTSILYRYIHIGDGMLFGVCGIFFASGIYGMFQLLKQRFTNLISLFGAIMFASFTSILAWSVSGTLDVPATCLAIWTIFLTYYGLNKNKKIIYLIFPVAAITFLVRYTSGMIILPIAFLFLVYFIENGIKKEDLKKIIISIFIGLCILIPFFIFFYYKLNNPFPFLDQFSVSVGNNVSNRDPGLMIKRTYFIENLPNLISASLKDKSYGAFLNPIRTGANIISYILLLLGTLGVFIAGMHGIHKYKFKIKINNISSNKKRYLMYIITFLTFISIFITFFGDFYLVCEGLMFIFSLESYLLFRKLGIKYYNLDLAMFVFFATFFISHSFLNVKVDRYFISMVPGLVYMLILGLKYLGDFISEQLQKYSKLDYKVFKKEIFPNLLILILTVCLFISSFYVYAAKVPYPMYGYLEDGANCLMDLDQDYKGKIIYSNHWPAFTWYLKTNVERGYIPDFNITGEENQTLKKFSEYLILNNATYYIHTSVDNTSIPNYTCVANTEHVSIYKRN